MPKPLAINTDLRPDVQATLHDVADRIRDRLKLTIKNIIEIGHDLHAVKKALGNVMATNALPISLPPYGLTRPQAAAFVGLKLAKFDNEVKLGNLPRPVRFGRSTVWTTRALQEALDEMSGAAAEKHREENWRNVGANALRRSKAK